MVSGFIKTITMIVAVSLFWMMVVLGSPVSLIVNHPSYLFVILLTACGVIFSFGVKLPGQAVRIAFQGKETEKHRYGLYVKIFNYASFLSLSSGLIGSFIGLIQMLEKLSSGSDVWGSMMGIALLPLFYGLVISVFVFQPLKFSLICTHCNGSE